LLKTVPAISEKTDHCSPRRYATSKMICSSTGVLISSSTLEEALITFLGKALSRYEALRKRRGLTLL
jgi:hypothetical protein